MLNRYLRVNIGTWYLLGKSGEELKCNICTQRVVTADMDKPDSFPNITMIINTVVAVCLEEKDPAQAFIDIGSEYRDSVLHSIETFTRRSIEELINKSADEKVRELSEKDFANRLIDSTKEVVVNIQRFYKSEISLQDLLDSFSNSGIKDVANDAMMALGVPQALGEKDMDGVWNMSVDVVAYRALTEVYKELRKALVDERLAYERRIAIEAECAEAVSSITRYRVEMERVISEYLRNHYDTFEKGFAAMDQAIIEEDIDGYIIGNSAIQEVLGYHAQFTNMKEFDDLMLSDETFIL